MLEPQLEKGRQYAILPPSFNNSTYIERSTFEVTNVKLSDAVNYVLTN